ncbi:DUF368 domain-containing protein [Stieleria varia]|uniref:DUF368 domain-containing protein n=1 Tax=Stieleria varia TaxID=2528005 RepID=A0A5C6ASG0_9BACT|nr:DUF368 domain-containing protein [Stieleria varia]TWU02431.1 hypothetical protein Pla52n_34810 [Stieleria varia]
MQTTEHDSPAHPSSVPVIPDASDTPQNDAAIASDRSAGIRGDLLNVARGFCMGAADTVPGVSGGTVALILGHYRRLINAISHVDGDAIAMLRNRRWRDAWNHIDGRFLFALGAGIGTGIVCLAGAMHWLLDNRLPETFAVFFGLVLASAWIVMRHVHQWTTSRIVACTLGIAAAAGISFLAPAAGSTSLVYLFLSGSIAICAMILPGISGAFVLLLLGVYGPITGMIKDAAKGNVGPTELVQMGVFSVGCLFGLLAFSRVLRHLLSHHQDVTMAALVGLMLGSIAKLWPLQVPTPETADLDLKYRVMQYVAPGDWNGSLITPVALCIGAIVAVLALEKIASGVSPPKTR